jgi:hypothetical protein
VRPSVRFDGAGEGWEWEWGVEAVIGLGIPPRFCLSVCPVAGGRVGFCWLDVSLDLCRRRFCLTGRTDRVGPVLPELEAVCCSKPWAEAVSPAGRSIPYILWILYRWSMLKVVGFKVAFLT